MMTGLNRITSRIAEDSKKESDAALLKAQAEADAIIETYKKLADERTKNVLPRARATAAERTERRLAVAQMESRKLQLAAKQCVISKTFDQAVIQLTKLDDAKKIKWLANLAVKAVRNGSEKLILNTLEHTSLGPTVVAEANTMLGDKGNLTLGDAGRDFLGGLILSDGDVEVNCTISALINSARDELSALVGNLLFK